MTGRLEGGELRIGDELTVAHGDLPGVSAVIRAIEFHGEPGKITVAVDAELADSVRAVSNEAGGRGGSPR